jgi:purine-nucleoside phosphorylase
MPSTRAGARGADPFEQARLAARELLRHTGHDGHDVLVLLGTGLAGVAGLLGAEGPAVDLSGMPWFPRFTGIGHRSDAWPITVGSSRVLVIAGRLHLYEGLSPAEVVHPVRMAMAAGCHTVLLTCSAGAVHPGYSVGQAVVVSDHLNLTATSPLTGIPSEHHAGSPYVDLSDTWSPALRQLATRVTPSLVEGVYAQVPGPHLETPAEIRMLGALGADLVGMSMVPEAIAARHLGGRILGLAVVTNAAAGTAEGPVPVAQLAAIAGGSADRVAGVLRGVIEGLDTVPAAADGPEGP